MTTKILFILTVCIVLIFIVEERNPMLQPGQKAPEIVGTTQSGETFRLSDELGRRNVVLYFYPKDFSPGCTAEACSFRDGADEMRQLDAIVVGLSYDTGESHTSFAAEHRLSFPLLSDGDRSISRRYGATWLGGLLWFPKRVTYVIDKEGVIRGAFHHELRVGRHFEEVLAVLKSLEGTARK